MEHQPQRRLSDDAAFFDDLLSLDRGLTAEGTPPSPPSPSPYQPASSVESGSVEIAPGSLGPPAVKRRPWREAQATIVPQSVVEPPPPPPPTPLRTSLPPDAHARAPMPLPPQKKEGAYEQFYGLEENPFAPSFDARFVYRSASFERASADVVDALQRGEGVILVTGEKGVGKTTLGLWLTEQLRASTRARFLTHPPESVDALFGATPGAGVVMLDNAQHVSTAILTQVQRLAQGGRGGERLQFVLIGEPALLKTVARRALGTLARQARTRCRIEPLAAEETPGYLQHRLAVAGDGTRVEFDEEAVAVLHAVSGGIPRLVNLMADRALAAGHRASTSFIDRGVLLAVARELGFSSPSRVRRALYRVANALILLLLLAAGAAAAAWVFRGELDRIVRDWDAQPAPPAAPVISAPELVPPQP